MTSMDSVLAEIKTERRRQDNKWGSQRRQTDGLWLAILSEEVGEVARAILEDPSRPREFTYISCNPDVHKELIQVAAVCVAWVEASDAEDKL